MDSVEVVLMPGKGGVLPMQEIALGAFDIAPTTVRCGFCPWTSSGPAAEAIAAQKQHAETHAREIAARKAARKAAERKAKSATNLSRTAKEKVEAAKAAGLCKRECGRPKSAKPKGGPAFYDLCDECGQELRDDIALRRQAERVVSGASDGTEWTRESFVAAARAHFDARGFVQTKGEFERVYPGGVRQVVGLFGGWVRAVEAAGLSGMPYGEAMLPGSVPPRVGLAGSDKGPSLSSVPVAAAYPVAPSPEAAEPDAGETNDPPAAAEEASPEVDLLALYDVLAAQVSRLEQRVAELEGAATA